MQRRAHSDSLEIGGRAVCAVHSPLRLTRACTAGGGGRGGGQTAQAPCREPPTAGARLTRRPGGRWRRAAMLGGLFCCCGGKTDAGSGPLYLTVDHQRYATVRRRSIMARDSDRPDRRCVHIDEHREFKCRGTAFLGRARPWAARRCCRTVHFGALPFCSVSFSRTSA